MRTLPLRKIGLCIPGVLLMIAALLTRPGNADDFRAFDRAASLIHSNAGIYSDSGGNTPDTFLPFLRLPSYAWMLHPLTLLSYPVAHAVWIALLALAFGVFLRMNRQSEGTALAVCYSVPAGLSLVLGQDIALVILIALVSIRCWSANRRFTAGAVASLLMIKLTCLFPVGLVFLARCRRGVGGLTAGVAIQLALCFAAGGWRWPLEYLAVLRNPLLDPEPRRMLSLRALTALLPHGGVVFAVAAAVVIAWLWYLARRLRFEEAMQVALPLGLIASAHSYAYDAVVLIPLFVSVASFRTLPGRLALLGLTPIPYFLVLGVSPAGAFIGSASVIAAVVLAVIELDRRRAIGAEKQSARGPVSLDTPVPATT